MTDREKLDAIEKICRAKASAVKCHGNLLGNDDSHLALDVLEIIDEPPTHLSPPEAQS